MDELFKALANLPIRQPKKYYMKTSGNAITWIGKEKEPGSVEIDLQSFLLLQKGGIEKFVCDENKKISAKPHKVKSKYPMLTLDNQGQSFVDRNPFWVKDQCNNNDRKYSWKTK